MRYLSILKCKKIGLYLLSPNIEQDCWLWSYRSSQWGGNGSVENGLNMKCCYINTIPQTEGKRSPYLKCNTYSEGISCAISCSPAAIQEVPTGQSCGLVDQQYQYKHATAKVFPWIPILLSNCKSFPTQEFCCVWYWCDTPLWNGSLI